MFDLTEIGMQSNDRRVKNHQPCLQKGIIDTYKDTKFKEYVITHDTNYPVKDKEGDGDSFFIDENEGQQIRQPIKREIIYVEIQD